ncbi:DUF2867 domain-containing protein [Streptomyces sp. NBC_01304]|uniref:DUF2867 domain-containing protein n=1 Tax=Streptomyces sp. NBC_01304 TaxID=2903818 RepID=UPI002E11B01D|nr:DUF2867 domain-containing protein [Streptomyces sp. NBC_01304]
MSAIRDVHERIVEAPADVVGALLDRIAGADDPLFPTPAWGPMRLDRPLGVGAGGGHGSVRYAVTEYEPGRRVRFGGTPPLVGFHQLTVEPRGEACLVRHELAVEVGGWERLLWAVAVMPVHRTMVEEIFDNAERAATGSCARPVRWSRWVRLLNRLTWDRTETVETPSSARLIAAAIESPGYADAYRMELRPGMPREPAAWTGILRDAFPVLAEEDGELLLAVDTAGLTARASILVDERYVTLSTVVRADSLRGRLYWGVVRRGHPVMAKAMLRRTHRRLALAVASAGERAGSVAGRAVSANGPRNGPGQ